MSLDPSSIDMQQLLDFLAFLKNHQEKLAGYNTTVPVEGYILMGCMAALIHEYTLTFIREVNYVWTCPWFFGLPLFYINRYVPFINIGVFLYINFGHVPHTVCYRLVSGTIWLIAMASFFAQMIIILRTFALWQNNPVVVKSLSLFLTVSIILTFVLTGKQLGHMNFAPTPKFLPGCIAIEDSDLSLYVYVVLFVMEAIIVGLTVIKAIQHLRASRTSWLSQLYKNGIFYCLCVLALSTGNIIVPLVPTIPYAYKQTMRMPQHVLHSIFCNRVILQILQYRHEVQQQDRLSAQHRPGTPTNIFTTVIDEEADKTQDMELVSSDETQTTQNQSERFRRAEWIS
ncbi:hypothetical protein FA15DRAFT_667262 [Coprinopsis marcescibilis]|uniref:DUF6533 domain-containing protein n=1 Tax=Coprinopsis marcescibilis TaxID=230819 RepID=A0A5C3L307_COPMA|nr:hypothetical protein FA15DRAFT_667262 [Coprinopsis marcescibilis]